MIAVPRAQRVADLTPLRPLVTPRRGAGQSYRRKRSTGVVMIRVLLAAVCLVLFAVSLQAGGLDDLKAANAAAEKGKVADPPPLSPRARESSAFSPADQLAARKGRGTGYTSKSL